MPVPGKGQTYTSDGGNGYKNPYTKTKTPSYNEQIYGSYGNPNWSTNPNVKTTTPKTSGYNEQTYGTYGQLWGGGIGNKTVTGNTKTRSTIPDSYGKYNLPSNNPKGGGGSGSSSSATYDGTGVGAGANATWDDIIEKIKALLTQQKTSADAYQKSLYEQALETARQSALNNQRQANRNYYAQNRRIGEMYGNDRSGMPMTQRFAAYSNLNNALAANDRDYANAKQTALTNYNSGLANNASTLAQGWYNYVLPVYTNRQQAIDNLNFYKSTL